MSKKRVGVNPGIAHGAAIEPPAEIDLNRGKSASGGTVASRSSEALEIYDHGKMVIVALVRVEQDVVT